MAKKIGLSLLAIIVIAAIAFFALAPKLAEESMNKVDGKPLPEIRADAQALHKTLTIVDLHSDSLLWKRDITERATRGHVDLPRLADGNVALQIFSSVTKTPKNQNYDNNSADGDNITMLAIGQMQPIRTWGSLLERSLYHAEKLDAALDPEPKDRNETPWWFIKNAEQVRIIADLHDPEKGYLPDHPFPRGALFSAEGLHSLEGKRENLGKLYDAGMRMAGLTHFFDNELAGSMHGETKAGLTEFGREIVRAMEEMGMIVDIAHLSHAGVKEVLASARRPVVSSHGGVQATCNVNRNLSDEEIKGVAATGGIIGVGYWPGAVCDTDPKAIAKAMKHIRDLVGIEHVALGSDYDGAVTTRFDTSGLVHVTQALMDIGFTDDEIRAAMGGNAISVITAGLVPFASVPKETPAE